MLWTKFPDTCADEDLGDDALLDLFLEEGDLGPDIHRELSRMGAIAAHV